MGHESYGEQEGEVERGEEIKRACCFSFHPVDLRFYVRGRRVSVPEGCKRVLWFPARLRVCCSPAELSLLSSH